MGKFTDYAENKIADFIRGGTLPLVTSWYFAFGTAADDATFTEITAGGYARASTTRALGNWAGTQGPGTSLASSGTSHTTSNNTVIGFGPPAPTAWGTITHVGLFDAASSGHCWMYVALTSPLVIASGDNVSIDAGALVFTLGVSGGVTDYLSNKMIDLVFRGQTFAWPAAVYLALFTTVPTNAAGSGVEVAGGSYARVSLVSSLTAICGTQSAGSTAVSSGNSGNISNNATLNFPTPTASWGTVVGEGIFDTSTAGNLLMYGAVTAKTINSGASPPTHAARSIVFNID